MYKYIKRFIDFMIALVALIILFVPLIIVAIIIKLDSKGPVIFKQDRLGKNCAFQDLEVPLNVRRCREARNRSLFF